MGAVRSVLKLAPVPMKRLSQMLATFAGPTERISQCVENVLAEFADHIGGAELEGSMTTLESMQRCPSIDITTLDIFVNIGLVRAYSDFNFGDTVLALTPEVESRAQASSHCLPKPTSYPQESNLLVCCVQFIWRARGL